MRVITVIIHIPEVKINQCSGDNNQQRTDYNKDESSAYMTIIFPGQPGIPWEHHDK